MLQNIEGRQVFLLWFNDGRADENEFIGVYNTKYKAVKRGTLVVKSAKNDGLDKSFYFYEEHFIE